MTKKLYGLAVTLLVTGSTITKSNAALVVDDFTISATSVSISISGSVDLGFIPSSTSSDKVFIGSAAPFDNWLLSDATLVAESNGIGATSNLRYTNSSGFAQNDFNSDWFRFISGSGGWSGGEVIDYTANFTGSFDVTQLPESIIITQGFTDLTQIIATGSIAGSGAVNSIPEPTSLLLASLGAIAMIAQRKRARIG